MMHCCFMQAFFGRHRFFDKGGYIKTAKDPGYTCKDTISNRNMMIVYTF